MHAPKKHISKEDAIHKLARFCAYQERSQQQVREKLLQYGIYGDDLEEVIAQLITEDFINEERFARSYARGKFRLKKWGKIKITEGLRPHRISAYCLKKALEEIDEDEYITSLNHLIEKKEGSLSDENVYLKKQKIARYLIGKGYEPALVWEQLKIS